MLRLLRPGRRSPSASANPATSRPIACARGVCVYDEREAVAEVARALVAPVELSQVAQTVVEQARRILGVDSVALWLADNHARELVLLTHQGVPEARLDTFRRLSYDAGLLTTTAARSGQIEEIPDIRAVGPELAEARAIAAQDATGSILAVPLHARGQLVGVMTCTRGVPHKYAPGERGLALTLADLFAAAIERAQFAQARQEAILSRLREVLAGMGRVGAPAEASVEGVVREIAVVARDLVAAEAAGLQIVDERGDPGPVTLVGQSPDQSSALATHLESSKLFALLSARDGPVRTSEVGAAGRAITSLLGMPIRYQDRLLGVLYAVNRLGGADFTEEDSRVIEMLVAHAAVAIENARLFNKAKEALHLREEFLSAAAHELKTPVTALRGYAQIMMSLPDSGDVLERQAREAILHSSERIARLVHGVLEVSAMNVGKLNLCSQPFDLRALAREVIDDVQVTTQRHQIVLRSSGSATVLADRDRVADVITGLLDNAIKFSPKGRTIEVVIKPARSCPAGEVIMGVRDHGPGIPPDRQAHIFEPLYEPQPSGSSGYVGVVGLGLYLSKHIVEAHGGRIWVESAEGKGSTFWIALPRAVRKSLDKANQEPLSA